MFQDDNHNLMHAGGPQMSPAVAAPEKSSVAEWGWDGSDRLYMWTRNRRAWAENMDVRCGPGRADRTGRGQKGRGPRVEAGRVEVTGQCSPHLPSITQSLCG